MRMLVGWVAVALAVVACGGSQGKEPQAAEGQNAAESLPFVSPPEDEPAPAAASTKAVSAGRPRDDLIPRATLFGNPDRTNVQISPDGKYLSWLAPSKGVLNVWVAKLGQLDQGKAVTADEKRPVTRYFWTFDGKHLLYLQDTGGDENFHVFRVDAETAQVVDLTPVTGARADVYALSERKPNQVLIGMNERDKKAFDVYQLDLQNGERSLVIQNDQGFVSFNIDRDLGVRFARQLAPDGSSLLFARDAAKGWLEYDKVPADDTLTTDLVGFDKRGKRFFALDSRDRNTGGLYEVDVKSKKKTLLYEDARADVRGVLMHPTEHTVQAVLTSFDRPRWVPVDKAVRADFEAIEKVGEGFVSVASRTLDDKTWIVSLVSDHASPKYFTYDKKTRKTQFLFSARPELDPHPLVSMRPTLIRSRDGLDMVSYLSLPKDGDTDADGRADKPLPMVLLVHGGPWSRDEWGMNPLHQLLANRGYAVLSVNYRGSTGFGKAFINAGNKQWGKKMHDDLLDAVRWAIDGKLTTADKACIMGGSYGGYATLAGLTLTPDTFACGVDIVGPSSIVTLLETIPPYWAPMVSLFHNRVGDPRTAEGKAALLEVSPLSHAAKIKRPLLVAQGANDPRVKKSEADQIVAAMKSKNIPVSYVVFPDEGHGFARPENRIAFYALTEAFLSVHLGGWFQPITAEELKASSLQIESGRESLPGLP